MEKCFQNVLEVIYHEPNVCFKKSKMTESKSRPNFSKRICLKMSTQQFLKFQILIFLMLTINLDVTPRVNILDKSVNFTRIL